MIEAWLAVPAPTGWMSLMLRRTPASGGFWQGVSGRVEAFDASLRAAALREIREETGIAAGVEIMDLGRWADFRGFTGTHYRKRVLGAVLPASTTEVTIALSDEHDAVRLLSFADARALTRWPGNAAELAALEAIVMGRPTR